MKELAELELLLSKRLEAAQSQTMHGGGTPQGMHAPLASTHEKNMHEVVLGGDAAPKTAAVCLALRQAFFSGLLQFCCSIEARMMPLEMAELLETEKVQDLKPKGEVPQMPLEIEVSCMHGIFIHTEFHVIGFFV